MDVPKKDRLALTCVSKTKDHKKLLWKIEKLRISFRDVKVFYEIEIVAEHTIVAL